MGFRAPSLGQPSDSNPQKDAHLFSIFLGFTIIENHHVNQSSVQATLELMKRSENRIVLRVVILVEWG